MRVDHISLLTFYKFYKKQSKITLYHHSGDFPKFNSFVAMCSLFLFLLFNFPLKVSKELYITYEKQGKK